MEPTNASGAIWWPHLQLMQVAPSGGQICNQCKWCHIVAKFNPSYGVNFWVHCFMHFLASQDVMEVMGVSETLADLTGVTLLDIIPGLGACQVVFGVVVS